MQPRYGREIAETQPRDTAERCSHSRRVHEPCGYKATAAERPAWTVVAAETETPVRKSAKKRPAGGGDDEGAPVPLD